jgi:hypothetical protein
METSKLRRFEISSYQNTLNNWRGLKHNFLVVGGPFNNFFFPFAFRFSLPGLASHGFVLLGLPRWPYLGKIFAERFKKANNTGASFIGFHALNFHR